MPTEERLIEIEIKLSRQEDMVETLNQMVYQQQKKIDQLQALCSALATRSKEMASVNIESVSAYEKPPHY